MILKLAKHLVLQGYSPKDITILVTYKGQMYYMKNVSTLFLIFGTILIYDL